MNEGNGVSLSGVDWNALSREVDFKGKGMLIKEGGDN